MAIQNLFPLVQGTNATSMQSRDNDAKTGAPAAGGSSTFQSAQKHSDDLEKEQIRHQRNATAETESLTMAFSPSERSCFSSSDSVVSTSPSSSSLVVDSSPLPAVWTRKKPNPVHKDIRKATLIQQREPSHSRSRKTNFRSKYFAKLGLLDTTSEGSPSSSGAASPTRNNTVPFLLPFRHVSDLSSSSTSRSDTASSDTESLEVLKADGGRRDRSLRLHSPPTPAGGAAARNVAFEAQVAVRTIPSRSELPTQVHQALWTPKDEFIRGLARNFLEYAMEGCDWRNAVEEDSFHFCQGQMVHPALATGVSTSTTLLLPHTQKRQAQYHQQQAHYDSSSSSSWFSSCQDLDDVDDESMTSPAGSRPSLVALPRHPTPTCKRGFLMYMCAQQQQGQQREEMNSTFT